MNDEVEMQSAAPMEEEEPFEDEQVGKEIKLTPDGGVVKKILELGEGYETPEKGDEVFVHYVGTLTDGTKFDSSRDRDSLFSFKLGEGRVIKGWDTGVATMKKGEKCILTCKPDYAYGAQGSPPAIPPNSTLNFEVELVRWQSVKDIMGDGGVIKTVVKQDGGYEMPGDKDEVLVHYKVTAAGIPDVVVASSPEAGFEFTLAAPGPDVLPGIAAAVKTMRKGDKVHLKLSPKYGYAEMASVPEGVAPGAALEVDLELVSWKKVEDVTPDGGVVRKVLSGPEQWQKTPNAGASVAVRLVGKLQDGTVFVRHEGDDLLRFVCDEGQVPEGLDLAVQKMKAEERNLVTVSPKYGYGTAEHAAPLAVVPPNSTLTYEVELVSHENAKESWEMSDAEKVEHAAAMKDKGNKAFKDGFLERAVRYYDKAVSSISYDKTFPDDVKATARELRKTAYLNLAAVKVKQSQWQDVVKNCDKVLEADADNIKALYRRAQAYLNTQDFLEAELDVKKALCLQPENADMLQLSKKLKVAQRELSKKESALYSKMFKPAAHVKAPAAAETATAETVAMEAAQPAEDASNNAAGGAVEASG